MRSTIGVGGQLLLDLVGLGGPHGRKEHGASTQHEFVSDRRGDMSLAATREPEQQDVLAAIRKTSFTE